METSELCRLGCDLDWAQRPWRRAGLKIFLPLEGKYLVRNNGSTLWLCEGFCYSDFVWHRACWIIYRITTVLLGFLLLQQSAKVTKVKLPVQVVLWFHKAPSPIFFLSLESRGTNISLHGGIFLFCTKY